MLVSNFPVLVIMRFKNPQTATEANTSGNGHTRCKGEGSCRRPWGSIWEGCRARTGARNSLPRAPGAQCSPCATQHADWHRQRRGDRAGPHQLSQYLGSPKGETDAEGLLPPVPLANANFKDNPAPRQMVRSHAEACPPRSSPWTPLRHHERHYTGVRRLRIQMLALPEGSSQEVWLVCQFWEEKMTL